MSQQSWAQQVTDRFFSSRASPPQAQCDEIARSISGSSVVRPVDSPGSMSYTVICDRSSRQQPDLVVSFREGEARLGPEMVKLAKQVHGQLVPESTWHGNVEGADPPLFIYSMPYLRGSSCVEAVAFEEEMGHADEAKHVVLLKHLAR